MRKYCLIFSILFWSYAQAWPAFRRVLIFSGGGLQTAIFLGYLDGLQERGWEPDLIVATCGGAVAGLIVQGIPIPSDRLKLLKSGEFHRELLRTELNPEIIKGSTLFPAVTATTIQITQKPPFYPLPKIFEKNQALLWVPFQFNVEFVNNPFHAQTRVVIIGTELLFSPDQAGKTPKDSDKKWYRETYYTDRDTGRYLDKRPSDIAKLYPDSAVASDTQIRTDVSLGQAARISLSDLYYVQPVKIEESYFAGGFINLFPIELALELGAEVVAIRSSPFSSFENNTIQSVFGFDGNARLQYVTHDLAEKYSDRLHWLEVAKDIDATYDKWGFNPKVTLKKPWQLNEPWVESRIPTDPTNYSDRVEELYQWGKRKAAAVRFE